MEAAENAEYTVNTKNEKEIVMTNKTTTNAA